MVIWLCAIASFLEFESSPFIVIVCKMSNQQVIQNLSKQMCLEQHGGDFFFFQNFFSSLFW